ncbi:MAG: hypothetical protein QOD93_479, partial [Acetobacteraceae bacterium]|nr:hypothetical protein [Acetobacteraceae bacterium]
MGALDFAHGTDARQLDGAVIEREAVPVTQTFGRCDNPLVLGLNDGAALAADQELHCVGMVRVFAGDEGAGCLQPMDQAVFHQEIKAAVGAG